MSTPAPFPRPIPAFWLRAMSLLPRPRRLAALFVLPASLALAAPLPTSPHPMPQPTHPRLFLSSAREAELRELAARDPFLDGLLDRLRLNADWLLAEPVVTHKLVGPRLLAESRAALAKIGTLALAHRFFGDERHAERAWTELTAVAAFPDWNPDHFLDTAEMAAAVAIGYDWLHDWLGEDRRAELRAALARHAFAPELAERAARARGRENNWNPVSNGGLVLAALAVAEHAPDELRAQLAAMEQTLPLALCHYAPDGAWYEGPGYWKYGTTYLAMLLDAVETAQGRPHPLADAPGLARTGDFFRATTGPGEQLFNYADARPHIGVSPAHFWLARRHHRPDLADFQRALLARWFRVTLRNEPYAAENKSDTELKLGDLEHANFVYSHRFYFLDIAWYHPGSGTAPSLAHPAGAEFFRGVVDSAYLRGPAELGELYVAVKGAGVPNAHAQLDAGSFVLDAFGRRWIEDLGPDNYDLPGYWEMGEDGRRWTYLRLGSLSHNVFTVDGSNQRTPQRVPLTAFHHDATRSHARFDLAHAYREQLSSASRGVALLEGRTVLIRDEVSAPPDRDTELRWAFLTRADITIDGSVATLQLGGQHLVARIVSPASTAWCVESATPPTAAENQNPGKRLLTFRLALTAGQNAAVSVTFTPGDQTEVAPPDSPLATWTGELSPAPRP